MPHRECLESYPLYRRLELSVPATLDMLSVSAVHTACATCGTDQTVRNGHTYSETFDYVNCPAAGTNIKPSYLCRSCRTTAGFRRMSALLLSKQQLRVDCAPQILIVERPG